MKIIPMVAVLLHTDEQTDIEKDKNTFLLTYLLTYLLKGAESFLRS